MNNEEWTVKGFEALTLHELYALLCLRVEIFVVEQACPYAELDGKDRHPEARHIWAGSAGTGIRACARILPPGLSYPGASIGRVAVARKSRGKGLARELVIRSLDLCQDLWPQAPVQIGAQAYLEKFYSSCGFEPASRPYLEDGIPHIDMVLNRS